jgi:hypothetical protein
MTKKGTTPDEQFLCKFYSLAMEDGDPHSPLDYRGVGKAIGLKETASKNIVKHLAQANFVKKIDDTTFRLTPHGCNFVLDVQA